MLISLNNQFVVRNTYGGGKHLAVWDLEGYKKVAELPRWVNNSFGWAISNDGCSFAWVQYGQSSLQLCYGRVRLGGDPTLTPEITRELRFCGVDCFLAFSCDDQLVYLTAGPFMFDTVIIAWNPLDNTVTSIDPPTVLKQPVSTDYQHSTVNVVPNPSHPEIFVVDVETRYGYSDAQGIFPYIQSRSVECPPMEGRGVLWMADGEHLVTWNESNIFLYDAKFRKVAQIQPRDFAGLDSEISFCKVASKTTALIIMQRTILHDGGEYEWNIKSEGAPVALTKIIWDHFSWNIVIPSLKPCRSKKLVTPFRQGLPLTAFPPEILLTILGHLDFVDLEIVSCSCKVIRSLCACDSLYRRLALVASPLMEKVKPDGLSWRDFYTGRARKLASSACVISVPGHSDRKDTTQYLTVS